MPLVGSIPAICTSLPKAVGFGSYDILAYTMTVSAHWRVEFPAHIFSDHKQVVLAFPSHQAL